MKRIILLFFASLFSIINTAQISIKPSTGGPDKELTLTYDAALGNKELVGETKIYIHHGIVTDKPDGTAWQRVKGNWGKDDGIGLMTKVAGSQSKWEIKFSPTLRQYFGATANENIFRVSCVFRNADGSKKGTIAPGNYGWGTVASNLDNYVNINTGSFLVFNSPTTDESFLEPSQGLIIEVTASSNVSSYKLSIDEGNGYELIVSTSSGQKHMTNHTPSKSALLKIKAEATINGENFVIEKNHNVIFQKKSVVQALPVSYQPGINYVNDSTVALVLEAPQKKFVYVVGDFSNWLTEEKYQMNITPDGNYHWIEITNLKPKKEYVFQYWVEGTLKIADPYADKLADPWNDQYIEKTVYPNLPIYNKTNFGIASVLQAAQEKYSWATSETTWKKPNIDHLVIYELHIRDFLKDHDMKTLVDSLDYLKRLGVNAIEFMPLSEFEGNDSWGYNASFHMAVDKYYGSKNDLKRLIEVCHQKGMAVILDMVLNHAYGQNPLVQLYLDGGKPALSNPWFNREAVGPYSWGFDFNHESEFTKRYVDRVNQYWLSEFHFDGFRFDFTKGFTNYAPGGNIDGFDQSRINILKRMAEKLRTVDQNAYIILEHWAGAAEEKVLGDYGMKMWRNKSYDFVPATLGNITGSFADMNAKTHVAFYNSHDERRIAEHVITEGRNLDSYDTKQLEVMYERVKMAAAFAYINPGPKMIWQFDELGYDINIDFNGRVGRKPLPWGTGSLLYYENELRRNIYKAYQGILDVRNRITPEILAAGTTAHQLSGAVRRLVFNTENIDVVLIGNFGLTKSSINPSFTTAGKWFDYFSGEEKNITNVAATISLEPGEWHLFTSEKMSDGKSGVVETFQNPVTITPANFTQDDEITITFDAKKASKAGTNGLINVDKVYFHSGVLKSTTSQVWTNIKGTLTDDGLGLMTETSDDIWELKIIPAKYYGINLNEDIYKLAMYFRNGNNINKGKGFRDTDIYFNVASNDPFITIEPSKFDIDTEITITFNAAQGNRELVGSPSIYLHSGCGIVDTQNPESTAWNKVVGNWGKDDGVGKMTKVAGKDLYQIKLVPRTYYGLKNGDFPYWIAAVFRSPDGGKKGTGNPGALPNGYIAPNLDFFFKNLGTTGIDEKITKNKISIFPNPNTGLINFSACEGEVHLKIYSLDGKLLFEKKTSDAQVTIPTKIKGICNYTIENNQSISTGLITFF
jgi:1,4-alpha-glucan branching enzyme